MTPRDALYRVEQEAQLMKVLLQTIDDTATGRTGEERTALNEVEALLILAGRQMEQIDEAIETTVRAFHEAKPRDGAGA